MGGSPVKSLSSRQQMVALSLIAALLSACSLDPNVRKQNYFRSGQRYFEKGQYSEASIEFTNAIKVDPSYADAHYQLAESYLNLQQQGRAYQEFVRTVELRPDDYQARIEMANLLILGRDFPHAHEQADILLKKRPSDPPVHAMVSSLLAAEGDISGAIGEIQQTIALAPGRWEPYLSLAFLQLKNDQPDAAEASFKKVIDLGPKAMQAHLLLGNFYQSRNRLDEAERQFRAAVSLDPNTVAPREAIARLYLAEGKKAAAEEVLKQAKRDLPHNPDSFLALSNFYFSTGDLEKAVSEYQALYQQRPNDLQIKKKYIQLLIQTKRDNEARTLVDEILKSSPKDDDALVFRSQFQIDAGDVNDAVQTLEVVVNGSPNNIAAHYALGVAFEKQGNLERAENQWREALRLNPDFLDAERSIADAAMLQGNMNSLEDAASQMIRLQPGSPEGYGLRALSNINRARYAIAEQDVHRAIEVAPQSAFGYVQMGNLSLAQKHYSDAAKAYQDALDRNANSTDALRGLVNAYVAEKQPDMAIATVNGQIGKSPANSNLYNLLGALLFHVKKDFNGAETALAKSIELDSHNYQAWIQLCQVRAAKGEIDQAIATGEQSLKDNPRQPNLDLLLGNLYESKSAWKEAQDSYQKALALNSQNPMASNDLARMMLQTGGNFDVELSLAQTALKGLPESPAIVDTLGWIYYQKGVYPLAINYLQEALRLQEKNKLPDSPDIHYHLGMAYAKTEQPALARQQFQEVLKLSPNYRDADQIQKEFIRLKS
jgi:tetratricopeptide (TPR) repeat protein